MMLHKTECVSPVLAYAMCKTRRRRSLESCADRQDDEHALRMRALEFGAEPATVAVDRGADRVQKTLGKDE